MNGWSEPFWRRKYCWKGRDMLREKHLTNTCTLKTFNFSFCVSLLTLARIYSLVAECPYTFKQFTAGKLLFSPVSSNMIGTIGKRHDVNANTSLSKLFRILMHIMQAFNYVWKFSALSPNCNGFSQMQFTSLIWAPQYHVTCNYQPLTTSWTLFSVDGA